MIPDSVSLRVLFVCMCFSLTLFFCSLLVCFQFGWFVFGLVGLFLTLLCSGFACLSSKERESHGVQLVDRWGGCGRG